MSGISRSADRKGESCLPRAGGGAGSEMMEQGEMRNAEFLFGVMKML